MTSTEIPEEDRLFIEAQVLLNAKMHDGKPHTKAILGKILGTRAALRKFAKAVNQIIEEMIDEIAPLNMDEIAQRLELIAPDAEQSHVETKQRKSAKRKEEKKGLPELSQAKMGKVMVRYAPDPSKYPHLGQGMNYLINRMYADKYEGKVLLRFDDTNPAIVSPEYYDAIKEGMLWLGATWDEEVRASQFTEEFYEISREFIVKQRFYVCLCKGETLSNNRNDGLACEHREFSVKQNLELFDEMKDGRFSPGEAVIRLMGDLTSNNMVMRDPIMMRVVDQQHPMLSQFYHLFPMYDFESAYLDGKFGITHVIRSGEFGPMRQKLQSELITMLGGKVPEFVSFGRFNIQGSPTKGRVIRDLVESGVVTGWDDIRLLTLTGLQKRGIHPQTAISLIQEAGLSPKNSQIAWKTLEAKSKELLEPIAKRFFFIVDPIDLLVEDAKGSTLQLKIHPDHPEYGNRTFNIDGNFFISQQDVRGIKEGMIIRLKDCYNVKISQIDEDQIRASYVGSELLDKVRKIHWVTHDYLPGTLDVPGLLEIGKNTINENSMSQISGYFEANVETADLSDVVQLERVGYAKLFVDHKKVHGHIVHAHR